MHTTNLPVTLVTEHLGQSCPPVPWESTIPGNGMFPWMQKYLPELPCIKPKFRLLHLGATSILPEVALSWTECQPPFSPLLWCESLAKRSVWVTSMSVATLPPEDSVATSSTLVMYMVPYLGCCQFLPVQYMLLAYEQQQTPESKMNCSLSICSCATHWPDASDH